MMNIRRSAGQRGYSLTELLVVVAIIGVLSLVTIPGFINMYRARKLRTSLTKVANDLRGARQAAVSHSSTVRMAYAENGRAYYLYESTDEGATWNALGANPRMVEDTVYFANEGSANAFTDTVDGGEPGNLPDIVFLRNGVAQAPGGQGKFLLKSNYTDIGKNTFTLSVRTTGMVMSE
jgi:prepilin-type N-terminal cleavage/methylation domain-containing protein